MTTTRTFSKAPSTLPMMLKAVLPALPVVGSFPGVKHARGSVPDVVLERKGVTTDRAHLESYNEVCGFPLGDTLPATYPHMAAFALHMSLMTDTSFPFAPMGLVHLRNSITQHRPIKVDETYDISVRAADLRTHPKGSLIDLITEATIDGTVVWEELTTLFSRHNPPRTASAGGAPRGAAEKTAAPLAGIEAPGGVVHWKLSGDLGRRYGAVSGDRNPIHLYPLTAKAFGFPTNIAHGMWTLARSLSALQNKLPDVFTAEVEFRKPIFLPGTVVFGLDAGEDGITFGVKGTKNPPRTASAGGAPNRTHLVGRIVTPS